MFLEAELIAAAISVTETSTSGHQKRPLGWQFRQILAVLDALLGRRTRPPSCPGFEPAIDVT
jgi:hypothetical protein